MAGHFEKGIWIQDSRDPQVPDLHYRIGIDVDASQLDELKDRLEEMRALFSVPESMTTFGQRLRWLLTGRVR